MDEERDTRDTLPTLKYAPPRQSLPFPAQCALVITGAVIGLALALACWFALMFSISIFIDVNRGHRPQILLAVLVCALLTGLVSGAVVVMRRTRKKL